MCKAWPVSLGADGELCGCIPESAIPASWDQIVVTAQCLAWLIFSMIKMLLAKLTLSFSMLPLVPPLPGSTQSLCKYPECWGHGLQSRIHHFVQERWLVNPKVRMPTEGFQEYSLTL